jgi:hypothetical protein
MDQTDTPGDSNGPDLTPVTPVTQPAPLNNARILKVIPDYQTVRDPKQAVAPMTAREKWALGLREVVDPFNIANAALTAAFSQHGNQTPSYGEGWANYGKRFGAAVADFGSQSFLSAGLFSTVLHQDPRYFRKGPGAKIPSRILYSASRLFICRDDLGRSVFNASNLLGMSTGIALSNLYYPSASRTGSVMAGRLETSMLGGLTGNLLSEFWPDLQRKFFRRKARIVAAPNGNTVSAPTKSPVTSSYGSVPESK